MTAESSRTLPSLGKGHLRQRLNWPFAVSLTIKQVLSFAQSRLFKYQTYLDGFENFFCKGLSAETWTNHDRLRYFKSWLNLRLLWQLWNNRVDNKFWWVALNWNHCFLVTVDKCKVCTGSKRCNCRKVWRSCVSLRTPNDWDFASALALKLMSLVGRQQMTHQFNES